MQNALKTNPERTALIIDVMMKWYNTDRDGLMEKSEMPESSPPSGMARGSYEHIMWLTLTVSIDYQRSAAALWKAARITWIDKSTRWIFNPHDISAKSLDELVVSLRKYKLSQKTTKDAKIWRTVAVSFLELFQGDPINLLKSNNYDAFEVYKIMRLKYSKKFPYLSGASGTSKILSLWIRMLKDEAHIDLKNLENVPIPIDVHTARATITTGCLVGRFEGPFKELAIKAQDAWIEACKKTGSHYYPLQLDEPLWNLSRLGCSHRKNGSICPISDKCRLSSFCTANDARSIISPLKDGNTTINTRYPG